MSQSPLEPAPNERLSQRGRRALGVGALAIIVIAVASFAYLRPNITMTNQQTSGEPSTNPSPEVLTPVSYSFVTPSLGWAVVNPVTASGSVGQFFVFRTVDAAKHWQQQLTGPSDGPGFQSMGVCCLRPITVHFFDKTHGFMVVDLAYASEQVYLTSDGGDHWHAVRLPAPPGFVVTFSDVTHGWALAQVNPPQAAPLSLYETSDAGAKWVPLPDPPEDAYYLASSGPNEVWTGSLSSGSPHAYTSADAGQTWQRHDLPPPPGRTWHTIVSGTAVQLLPDSGVVATTESGVNAGGISETDQFTSFDGGSTWRYVSPAPGEVGYQDAFDWWAISDRNLYKSSDAGQTWSLITDALPNWQFLGGPIVIDSRHALAYVIVGGASRLALTSDAGFQWTLANVPHP